MAFESWTPVSWQQNDVVSSDKMQQDSANLELLRNSTPRSRYRYGIKKDEGLRLLAGMAVIPRQKDDSGSVTVRFDEFFTTDCIPIITTGTVSPMRRVHVTLSGIDQLIPDDRGFKVFAQMDNPNTKNGNNRLRSKIYVPWLAMGY